MAGSDRVGGYELIRRIGRGGMAEVHLARKIDDILHKDVVIKLMHDHLAEDERFVKMFLREATIASRMNHTNVVQVLEVGRDEERYFLAMEYLEGASLQGFASRAWGAKMPLPLELVARAIGDAGLGLHYAHNLKGDGGDGELVHRDISPDNLFLTRSGVTKVLDFGIATGAFTGKLTRTGELKGKVRYMSPEQIDGAELDGRSDIFSLGVTAYRLFTGKPPFDGPNELQCMRSVVEDEPPPPSHHNPHLPRAIDDIVMGMLEKDPARRTRSGEDIYDALSDFDGGATGRQVCLNSILQILALPPNNRMDVPTWVTRERPAVAPARSGSFEIAPISSDARTLIASVPEAAALTETSQPSTAELGAAAQELRSRREEATAISAPPLEERDVDDGATIPVPAAHGPDAAVFLPPDVAPSAARPAVPLLGVALTVGLLVVAVTAVVVLSLSDTPQSGASIDVVRAASVTVPERAEEAAGSEESDSPAGEPAGEGDEGGAGDELERAPQAAAEVDDDKPAEVEPADAEARPSPRDGAVPATRKPVPAQRRASREPGQLIFRVVPYGEVQVNGKMLGTTPLPPLEVPPGNHQVVIRYGDVEKRLRVRVRSGENRTVRMNMTQP